MVVTIKQLKDAIEDALKDKTFIIERSVIWIDKESALFLICKRFLDKKEVIC